MILVTGGTGFIGRALIRHLVDMGHPVRALLRPSNHSPNLPTGIPIDVTVSSLSDIRGLRAAMVGVDTIFHLASGEWQGTQASLLEIDVRGTQAVLTAAEDANIDRFFYISHLGADRASAYPVLKAKAISEEFIRRSGIPYSIFRTAIVFGRNDGFTTGITQIMSAFPFLFFIPGSGKTLLQPLWIEDLAVSLTWTLEERETLNKTIDIGGPEYLSFNNILDIIMHASGIRRTIVRIPPPYMRGMTILLESIFPNLPMSLYWLDYLASNRTCALDSIPRTFDVMPSRMSQSVDYLGGSSWRTRLFRKNK